MTDDFYLDRIHRRDCYLRSPRCYQDHVPSILSALVARIPVLSFHLRWLCACLFYVPLQPVSTVHPNNLKFYSNNIQSDDSSSMHTIREDSQPDAISRSQMHRYTHCHAHTSHLNAFNQEFVDDTLTRC